MKLSPSLMYVATLIVTISALTSCKRVPVATSEAHRTAPDSIRGVYLNPRILVSSNVFERELRTLQTARINTIVVDIKDGGGIQYQSRLSLPSAISRHSRRIRLDSLTAAAHENGFFVIGRIVTFNDPTLARSRHAWILRKPDGEIWLDPTGSPWVDPRNRNVWRYNILIALDAASKGIDAIQFDYVRFPEGFGRAEAEGPSPREQRAKSIALFLDAAHERLKTIGVLTMADVFGYAMNTSGDVGIGQHWESLVSAADGISPMTYPSHYSRPLDGPHPNSCPYASTINSLSLGIARVRSRHNQIDNARVIPWLQGFDAPWIDRSVHYGPKAIAAQISAVYDAGARDWLIWNPNSTYDRFLAGMLKPRVSAVRVDDLRCHVTQGVSRKDIQRSTAAKSSRATGPFDQ